MKTSKLLFIPLVVLGLAGCKTTQNVVEPVEERTLEEIVVEAEPAPQEEEKYELGTYNPSYTRTNDLIHTKLDLKFDWDKQHVLGEAWLDFQPLFYATDKLELDAKGFDIAEIKVNGKTAKYDYKKEDDKLYIDLGKKFTSKEKYKVYIKYTAKPNERKYGGSAAITSEKGLFFINPLKKEGDKPQQIWTQGETENNSAWFPTVDKPNERTTQEVYLTVRDEFETLCNGLLKSSKKNSDGTRTDYWKMSLPHAPYLFMLAIGDFAVVKDSWNGMLLEYYVEKEYKPYAKEIFAHTPEMLTFFSDFMGVKYPWEKYSQVVVRDYVSGAMENTTAVIFGDFVQRTDRELIDNGNERIVAHEMMHHWFGDLVTCESWANLSMNEGFANYSEYLWFEHKYGRDYADYHLMGEQQGYIASANQGGAHPLIYFGYEDKESMFDAHSYNKGGAILHMLRYVVGTDAFRKSLKLYLEDNEYTAVEAHDLRLAFEEVTGRDLNWFFNQWYFNQGHPNLDVQYDYDAGTKEAIVSIEQTQDPKKNPPIFVLPMAVHIYDTNGKATRHEIIMDKRGQEFRFKVDAKPALIQADADRVLLAEIKEEKTKEEKIFQFYNAPLFRDRYDAMMGLKGENSAEVKKLMEDALNDPFWSIRNAAVTSMNLTDNPAMAAKLAEMAKKDKHSTVRSSAILALAETGNKDYAALAKNAIDNEKPYTVVSAGLSALTKLDPESAAPYAAKLENEKSSSIVAAVGQIYAQSGDVSKMSFFENKFDKVDGYGAIEFMGTYAQLATKGGDDSAMKAADNLNEMSMNMSQSPWRRFGSTRALHSIYMNMKTAKNIEAVTKLKGYMTKIKETETNDQLKSLYNNLPL